jgi:hypothetical protein
MATRRYSIERGDSYNDVVEAVGLATVTKEIEVTVDLATINNKQQVLQGLEEIKKHIMKGGWPPA